MSTLNDSFIVQSNAREHMPDISSQEETRLHHLKLRAEIIAQAFWVGTERTERMLKRVRLREYKEQIRYDRLFRRVWTKPENVEKRIRLEEYRESNKSLQS